MQKYSNSFILVAALGLASCNTQQPQQQIAVQEPAARARLVSDPNFKLPEGTGCGGTVNRFRAIIDNDLETGHTTKSTHFQMSAEIDRASSICANGNDGAARSMISGTRAKFGYPAG